MKRALLILLLLGVAGVTRAADDEMKQPTPTRLLVLLGSFKDFKEAREHAQAIGRTSGMPFSMQGMIYDKKRGLILPDDDSDAIYAGSYILRRYDTAVLGKDCAATEYLSIERSDAYPELRAGYYIIVGGIYGESGEARKALARFKSFVADAEIRKTQIYMGCMH